MNAIDAAVILSAAPIKSPSFSRSSSSSTTTNRPARISSNASATLEKPAVGASGSSVPSSVVTRARVARVRARAAEALFHPPARRVRPARSLAHRRARSNATLDRAAHAPARISIDVAIDHVAVDHVLENDMSPSVRTTEEVSFPRRFLLRKTRVSRRDGDADGVHVRASAERVIARATRPRTLPRA